MPHQTRYADICTFPVRIRCGHPQPTRFLSDLQHFEGPFYRGIPAFDADWKYTGPLPRGCPHPKGQHEALIGTTEDGQWKTAPAAHYPGPLCRFLAIAIYRSWADTSSASLGSCPSEVPGDKVATAEDAEEEDTKEPQQATVIDSGCQGPPLTAKYAGRSEFFCDGMGLCSPGRWHPHLRQRGRTVEQQQFCEKLAELIDKFCAEKLGDLATASMRLALGRFQQSPFTASDLQELRQRWFDLLPDRTKAMEVPADQPFFLHALAQSLRLMGDPDTEIIDGNGLSSFVNGVHIGHLHPLGPTPQVFRPRVKEPSYDETGWDLSMDNYFRGTEAEAEAILESHFKEEELEGRMKPVSEKEAMKQYPGKNLRVAAQGILDKPDGGHRIIHDGTHGVRLNNEIQVLDRLENPGPRELATIMRVSGAANERVVFSVNADIAKAHRRVKVKVRCADWGVQACKTSSGSKVIWLNKRGTFGVASAAYWWSRLMGLLGRHAINLLGSGWIFILTFVDDLHIASGGPHRWKQIWRFIAAMEMVGTPFSYRKFRGGFTSDYVGYWVDYGRFEIGISERRTGWLVEFINKLELDHWLVLARRYQEFHGRLGFSAQVLPWLRPLLAPGYSWLSAVNKMSTVKVPELVAMTCIFIRQKLVGGLRKTPCLVEEVSRGELFRMDAKCEKGLVVLGGWLLGEKADPKKAAWFSLDVSPIQAPWLFKEGESSWASTSAELLASLVALKVFGLKDEKFGGAWSHSLACGGGTDNKSTGQLVQKRLSTKLPLMVVLMDYLAFCEEQGLRCQLDWRPRITNVEADQLTNKDFSAFDLKRRIEVSWDQLHFPMIELLMRFAESFSKRKVEPTGMEASVDRAKFIKSVWS